jgi:hypothetical protein
VVLKREAIFGQFLSLIQDEIRGSYRTNILILALRVSVGGWVQLIDATIYP